MDTTTRKDDQKIVEHSGKSAKEIIAINIYRFMNRNHLTQKELAALIGVRVTTVNNWIHGISVPSMNHIIKLAKTLDRDAADFFIEPKDGDTRNQFAYITLKKRDLLKQFDDNADFHHYVEIGLTAVHSGRISELLKKVEA